MKNNRNINKSSGGKGVKLFGSILTAGLLMFGSASFAQERDNVTNQDVDEFNQYDVNTDQQWDRDEFDARMGDDQTFDTWDTDRDGILNEEEFNEGNRNWREQSTQQTQQGLDTEQEGAIENEGEATEGVLENEGEAAEGVMGEENETINNEGEATEGVLENEGEATEGVMGEENETINNEGETTEGVLENEGEATEGVMGEENETINNEGVMNDEANERTFGTFDDWDKDKDGLINRDEYNEGVYWSIDSNQDGTLDPNEYNEGINNFRTGTEEELNINEGTETETEFNEDTDLNINEGTDINEESEPEIETEY